MQPKTAAEESSRVVPAEKPAIPTTGILIREPTEKQTATTDNTTRSLVPYTTESPSSPPLDPLFSLPTPPREQVILTKKDVNAVLDEFVGDGQSTGLDLNAELPTNKEILGHLPFTNEAFVSSFSTEVDEIIQIDPVPGRKQGQQKLTNTMLKR